MNNQENNFFEHSSDPSEAEFSKEEKIDDFDTLAEAAIDANLNVPIPKIGTESYRRLMEVCKNYSRAVHEEVVKYKNDIDGIVFSEGERRKFHNQLCIMLFGTTREETELRNQTNHIKAANFAHLVAGRDQYVE